jgi:hypothetical protein
MNLRLVIVIWGDLTLVGGGGGGSNKEKDGTEIEKTATTKNGKKKSSFQKVGIKAIMIE